MNCPGCFYVLLQTCNVKGCVTMECVLQGEVYVLCKPFVECREYLLASVLDGEHDGRFAVAVPEVQVILEEVR